MTYRSWDELHVASDDLQGFGMKYKGFSHYLMHLAVVDCEPKSKRDTLFYAAQNNILINAQV